jgi:predicted PurR-regulated permease PerM
MEVLVDKGGARSEGKKVIASVEPGVSITLTTNLTYTHGAGDSMEPYMNSDADLPVNITVQHCLFQTHWVFANVRLIVMSAANSVFHASIGITKAAFEVLIAIFFTFAVAAYWIFERDRARRVVLSLISREHRKVVYDTWELIDAKLGAFVRGQLILILFVATVLSLAFRLIGVPFWLLIGMFAGVVEIIPVIGPLVAGAVAIAVGFTVSWQVALGAGLAVLGVRLLEDYIVVPRVLGHAVGLSPLVVLVSVTAIGLLLGGVYILVAVPIAAVLVTLVDVVVRDKDPAEEEVPALLFPAKDAEA